ncbi:hypothetical protein MKW98_000673 [Papaver atlanticum]|uniref:sucrose synthase n=1 Tax=Papaver atlanticum TaxID=357466 RepID=A0AAD4T4F1_9MAGN|nr:hypothetical protein MKW98_000673 [Papaver atlanticum]
MLEKLSRRFFVLDECYRKATSEQKDLVKFWTAEDYQSRSHLKATTLLVTQLLLDAVGTSCCQRFEKVFGTEHVRIVGAPLSRMKGNSFCSNFHFLQDVAKELASELKAKPHLVVGNYSDGNFVASLLAHKLGAPQCQLLMLLGPNTLILIYIGKSLVTSIILHANSQLISLP